MLKVYFACTQDDDFVSLPYIEEFEAISLMKFFNVDTLPLLQLKTSRNSSDFERVLLTYLESNKVELVNIQNIQN